MRKYLVGGAVRDRLLGLEPKDRDYVVVGATSEEMVAMGLCPVGADFPVFIHLETRDEYALARTERKDGHGYAGFKASFSTEVTLEQDLQRRDLTINAIAMDEAGNIIDPFGGQQDLRAGILRHVSPAFAEDPLRVLRVARFAAQFGFHVAPETHELMCQMVESGEVDYLTPERIWKELERSLQEAQPSHFFEVLRSCGALKRVFPELDALFGVPQTEKHHPEICSGVHTLLSLGQAVVLTSDPVVRFAVLLHDLGKATTSQDEWPKHHGHEERSAELVKQFCTRLRVPNEYRNLAMLVAKHHLHCHQFEELKPGTILRIFEAFDAFRNPNRVEQFVLACEADKRGRKGCENKPYPQAEMFRAAFNRACSVNAKAIAQRVISKGGNGERIHNQIRMARIKAIRNQ